MDPKNQAATSPTGGTAPQAVAPLQPADETAPEYIHHGSGEHSHKHHHHHGHHHRHQHPGGEQPHSHGPDHAFHADQAAHAQHHPGS